MKENTRIEKDSVTRQVNLRQGNSIKIEISFQWVPYIVKDKIVLLVCSLLVYGAAIWKVSY